MTKDIPRQKVDPRITSVVSTICSSEGYVKDSVVKVIGMIFKVQSSFAPSEVATVSSDKNSLFDRSDVPSLCPELVYSLKRSIRGCASGKENCRVSCSVFFSALLSTFKSLLLPDIIVDWIHVLLSCQNVGVGKGKSDARLSDMGKLTAFNAILRYSLSYECTKLTCSVLENLLEIRANKSYFVLPVDCLFLEFISFVVDESMKQSICEFLLKSLKEKGSLLESALLSLTRQHSFFPSITNDSREIIDCLPRLHPVLKVLCQCDVHLVTPHLEALLSSHSFDIRHIGLLILSEIKVTEFPKSFFKLAEKMEFHKRSLNDKESVIREVISKILKNFMEHIKDFDLKQRIVFVTSLPKGLHKQIPSTLFDPCLLTDEMYAWVNNSFAGLKRAEIYELFYKQSSKIGINFKKIIGLLNDSDLEFASAFKQIIIPLCLSLNKDILLSLFEDISKFKWSFDHENPLHSAFKASSKLSKSAASNIASTASCLFSLLLLTNEPELVTLLEELEGFAKKTPALSVDEKSLFWSELVMTLITMEPSIIRRIAEVLMIDICKDNLISSGSFEPFFSSLELKPSSESFELEDDVLELNNQEQLGSDMDDEEMNDLDDKLAAAVSLHISSAASKKKEKKRVENAGSVIQSKILSLFELLGRSKEVSEESKFALLPRLLSILHKYELGDDNLDRLFKIVRLFFDSIKASTQSPAWEDLLEICLNFAPKREKILTIIVMISSQLKCCSFVKEFVKNAISSDEMLLELSHLLTIFINYNMGSMVADLLTDLLPINLHDKVRSYSKNAFFKSLRMLSATAKNPSITDYGFNYILQDTTDTAKQGPLKTSWIRNQISELLLWSKLQKGTSQSISRLQELRTLLIDNPALVSQLDNIIKLVSMQ